MKQAFELDPTFTKGDLDEGVTLEGYPHMHAWLFATIIPHQRQHVMTNQMMTMMSILMVCICGAQRHSWMVPPPELAADKPAEASQVPGGTIVRPS